MNFFKNLFGNKKEQEKKSGHSVNKKESLDKVSPTEVAELLLNVLPGINVDLSPVFLILPPKFIIFHRQ